MKAGKGKIRATNRQGTEDRKATAAERHSGRIAEPSVCNSCGAFFSRRTWRRDRVVTAALLNKAKWVTCPACKQVKAGEYNGRILLRGAFVTANEEAIRQRINGVAARAQATQPERRLVSVERDGKVLEVLTTSQKLAHRIVQQLRSTFRGRARYQWSDDGSLFAEWERA